MKILVAYDGSAEADRALDWAAILARGTAGSSVTVISVVITLSAAPPITDAVDPHESVAEHRADLDRAVATLTEKGVAAEPVLKAGNPAEEIIDVADAGGFDVIVVGSRGKSAAARFLMGSVSERVVRHASRPVLVARSTAR
jgi:nucleotide-binding universal stress UspA family protein